MSRVRKGRVREGMMMPWHRQRSTSRDPLLLLLLFSLDALLMMMMMMMVAWMDRGCVFLVSLLNLFFFFLKHHRCVR